MNGTKLRPFASQNPYEGCHLVSRSHTNLIQIPWLYVISIRLDNPVHSDLCTRP